MFIVQMEDYSKRPMKIIQEIWSFIGLRPSEPYYRSAGKHKIEYLLGKSDFVWNKGSSEFHEVMKDETKELLKAFFSSSNRELAILLEDEKYLWN